MKSRASTKSQSKSKSKPQENAVQLSVVQKAEDPKAAKSKEEPTKTESLNKDAKTRRKSHKKNTKRGSTITSEALKEETKKEKLVKFDLDFIYRREKYTLKNLMSNFVVGGIRKLIAKKLGVDKENIKIFYLNSELLDKDKQNIYDLISNNKEKYLEVKKEQPVSENIMSLNTVATLTHKLRCTNINNLMNFTDILNTFFNDLALEKHYLCEPTAINTYEVGFVCEDHAIQFKRYFTLMKKTPAYSELYKDTTLTLIKPKILQIKQNYLSNKSPSSRSKSGSKPKNKAKKNESLPKFIAQGPYMTYEEIKKKEEKESKKKWLNKNGFKLYSKIEED